jgi:DNA-binding ferritin-like protein (Dps family)
MLNSRPLRIAAVSLLSVACAGAFAAPPHAVKKPIDVQSQTVAAAVKSQKKINDLANQTQSMLGQYLDVTEQTQRLQTYNKQLQKLVASQEQHKQSIKNQMSHIAETQQGLVPLMLKMIDSLEQFDKLDIPYQLQDRLNKVKHLRKMMGDSSVTIATKYRQVLSAYQDEIDAGHTVQAYRGTLNKGGKSRTVDFLQVGRIGLYYQTLDRSETGYWDKSARQWKKLPGSYRASISTALQIANKSIAPKLMALPVAAPESAK